ncbi:serine protease [Delftia tsuruhatensis]|uniref:AVAST type 1 anti-phage system protease Avs1b n=1 Tax=Delftia tsuruhatensis TaxID=180282 RepID=UPI002443EB21|nr:AVAST type 1 anti-phage system protease Avs1b [Delftia tsuruhatensis]MDH0772434.1 serine protease [Delftia tsuruhatensis]MDH1457089.1 serine protease [Delftia tsuruhatensis]MDH1821886.1 serine protease [Delftia tsuruhatensis]WGG08615.1 serine protease [Delftia tsuruhatensis]
MTEEGVKLATCQVIGKDECGTGWLVAKNRILTAYHCVEVAHKAGEPVVARFDLGASASEHSVIVGLHDEELDVCMLELTAPLEIEPVPLNLEPVRPGEKWSCFGYPVVKLQLGHVAQGEVQQALTKCVHGVDLDLSVTAEMQLSDYKGLSGSALIVGMACKGLIRLNVDSALCALSLQAIKPFLEASGLLADRPIAKSSDAPIGQRPTFDALFESTLAKAHGGYVFLDGPHGIGKSTYCKEFAPQSDTIERLGVYHFSEHLRGVHPAYQAQPDIFFDWLNSLSSTQLTGRPARLLDLPYSELVTRTNKLFETLAQHLRNAKKQGVIFIDGINEAVAAGEDSLRRFVGLLPSSVPEGLVVVITGVGLDSIAASLSPILQSAERLTLPQLDDSAQHSLCVELLDKDKAKPSTVAALCDRAKGHPLYLRYLTELVNGGANQSEIDELPAFSGKIEDYYETIWAGLTASPDAVHLLALIARLRQAIPVASLAGVLTPSEAAALPSTLARIRHLLQKPEDAAIYHSSFSEFIVLKTATVDQSTHGRLADFCFSSESGDYGVLNKVFHRLRGPSTLKLEGVRACDQEWIDESVALGTEPDILLADIDDTLRVATESGSATEIVRLLLLSQRLSFRYDVLFVQCAELVARALVSLGKPEVALRHVVRHGRLILSADEAFVVAHDLIRCGNEDEALELLNLFQRELNQGFFERIVPGTSINVGEFFSAIKLHMHGNSLAHAAGAHVSFKGVLRAVVERFLPLTDLTLEQRAEVVRDLIGDMTGAMLTLDGTYTSVKEIGLPQDVDPSHMLLMLLQIVDHAQAQARHYSISLPRHELELLLQDVESLINAPLESEHRRDDLLDSLIESGANDNVVASYSVGMDLSELSLSLTNNNRAVPDTSSFEQALRRIRAAFFLDSEHEVPVLLSADSEGWEDWLQNVSRAVAWCDGKARRATAAKDEAGSAKVWAFATDRLLPSLVLDLESRCHWDSSYFIPEAVIPLLYCRLVKAALDCKPSALGVFIDTLNQEFDSQLGLYNEGFRAVLAGVLALVVPSKPTGALADKTFELTIRWRDYISANVENRFELVPELLQIIRLLVELGAAEEAQRTYRVVLSFSMGPNWYKEDQLSLMSGTLKALPAKSLVSPESIREIAGLLERASGEMTFQRFVRADKGSFIAELCRRTLYSDAVKYFQHQSCGTREQLYTQATTGNLDRISTLVGMRFPGAALEEQSALLALLRKVRGVAHWRVRWALLEVFLRGDERHLPDWGREFGTVLSELTESPDDLTQARDRLRSIIASLSYERAWLLMMALVPLVSTAIRQDLEAVLAELEARLEPGQVSQLESIFDVKRELAARNAASTEPAEEKQSGGDRSATEWDEDALYMPGTFGKKHSLGKASERLESARRQVSRGNSTAAVRDSIAALNALQDGGWSIWSGGHSHLEAEKIISTNVQGADELARAYGPLLLDERYNQRWMVANHIINLIGSRLDPSGQSELLKVAIDHVRRLVGAASPESFSYIASDTSASATEALNELLLWAIDHPSWERRDSAAAMVLWCARCDPGWLPQLARLAVSMDSRARADIAAAVLDIRSRERAAEVWHVIEPHVPWADGLTNCSHVGRLATILRIAERASNLSIDSASNAVTALKIRFSEGPNTPPAASGLPPPPYLPSSVRSLWHDLDRIGALSEPVLDRFEATLRSLCVPHSVETVYELENLVADGARESRSLPTGRWASLIRYALNVALFESMPASQLRLIESALRAYNPGQLTEPETGHELLRSLVDSVSKNEERSYRPVFGDLVLLDLQSFVELNHKVLHLELTSHLIPPGQGQPPISVEHAFKATELPRPGPEDPIVVCGRAMPAHAYFGSITPAIPTPRFLHLLRASSASTVRYHWRDGAGVEGHESHRRFETAVLGIRREAFELPDGWRVQWLLRVDGKLKAILQNY